MKNFINVSINASIILSFVLGIYFVSTGHELVAIWLALIEIHMGICSLHKKREVDQAAGKKEFADMVKKGTEAWQDVPSASGWVEDLRGNEDRN